MSSRTFTVRSLESIRPGPNRQEIPDHHLPGLYLIVQPSGAKSWAVRYRSGGRTRKHTLGGYPALDLKAARALASEALRTAAEGRDPGQEKAQARSSQPDTVGAVARLFVERYCLRHNRTSTAATTQRLLDQYVLPRWRDRPFGDITRRNVRELVEGIVAVGKPVQANRVLSIVRKLFNWAVENDIVSASPCVGVKKPSAEQSRERVLSNAELRNVWAARQAAQRQP